MIVNKFSALALLCIALSKFHLVLGTQKQVSRLCFGYQHQYVGHRKITEKGRKCHRWTKKYHEALPDKRKRHNFCRNPTNSERGPWCMVKIAKNKLKKQYCGIPKCAKDGKKDVISDCVLETDQRGLNYVGKGEVTVSKHECLNWLDSRKSLLNLNKTTYRRNIMTLKIQGDANHNYCRNPDNSTRPWCYKKVTKKNERNWGFCNEFDTCTADQLDFEPTCGIACPLGIHKCTFQNPKSLPTVKVYNGQNAKSGEWPWMVGVKDPLKQQIIGGGSIINKRYILTAAHILANSEGSQLYEDGYLKIVTGWHHSNDDTIAEPKRKSLGLDVFDTSTNSWHEDYDGEYHDIGLIELENDLIYPVNMDAGGQSYIRPACLATSEFVERNLKANDRYNKDATQCYVVGYGTTGEKEDEDKKTASRPLQEAMLEPLQDSICDKKLQSTMNRRGRAGVRRQGKGEFCGYNYDKRASFCSGDSGGPYNCPVAEQPLIVKEMNTRKATKVLQYAQVGIVAWNLNDCSKDFPAVFTRVSKYIEWIRTIVEPLSFQVL